VIINNTAIYGREGHDFVTNKGFGKKVCGLGEKRSAEFELCRPFVSFQIKEY
jgi:hypothetical protein